MEQSYPLLAPILGRCNKVVDDSRRCIDDEAELELRFGSIGHDGKYVNGVSREFMDRVLTMIQTNKDMKGTDWCEYHDFYFNVDDGTPVRTRVTFDTDELVIATVTSSKVKTNQAVFKDQYGNAVKFSSGRERKVQKDKLPSLVNTEKVRIQQRRSFVYDSTWSFDFSLTWAGATKTEAEQAQQNEDPVYEIEIELLDREYLKKHDDNWVSVSFLLKALISCRSIPNSVTYSCREANLLIGSTVGVSCTKRQSQKRRNLHRKVCIRMHIFC